MFCCPRRRRKRKRHNKVEVGDEHSSNPQESVDVEKEDQKQEPVVPDTLVTSAIAVSAPTEAPKDKAKKASWWQGWSNRKTVNTELHCQNTNVAITVETAKETEGGEASPNPEPTTSNATETDTKKKEKPWWCWCLSLLCNVFLCKKHTSVAPVLEDEDSKRTPPPEDQSTKGASNVTCDNLPAATNEPRKLSPTVRGGSTLEDPGKLKLFATPGPETISREELVCLGLPNLAQTCYMNSTLQGLLTLTSFVQEFHNQYSVWSSHPDTQLFRLFMDVGLCRFTNNRAEKKSVLAAFKRTVAEFNSEFMDGSQKDAHEFLSCVLDNLRSPSVNLHTAALRMDINYTCPVNAHIALKMLSTRTCNGCDMQSLREEDYTNLSLDLVPGGSVSEALQNYLKKRKLEYRCECGANESTQQWSFLSRPNVLILQLQRFRFTQCFKLEKEDCPVELSRELVVTPETGITDQTRYKLVSIISHLGSTAHSGHYICDGAHCQNTSSDMTDRWLTYNDTDVSVTTGTSVCHERRRTAYLLFYEQDK